MSDTKIEMLIALQKKQDAVNLILEGARLVTVGGVEGIQEAAKANPELILTAINILVDLIDSQQKQQIVETEQYLELLDQLDNTTQS